MLLCCLLIALTYSFIYYIYYTTSCQLFINPVGRQRGPSKVRESCAAAAWRLLDVLRDLRDKKKPNRCSVAQKPDLG